MKANHKKAVLVLMLAAVFAFSGLSSALAEEYDAMAGVDNVKVMFDMRDGVPELAAVHMKLLHDTYHEFKAMKKNPIFVVVFMAGSVKLISSDRLAFKTEDQKYLKEIDETMAKMARDGIHLEVCLAAVEFFGIDPATISSHFKRVNNGWISEIGYQARGYSLVPVY